MEELFDILDESGNKTGMTKPRALVHKDGDWHKSVHIWIANDNKDILLQKRSPNKDSYPNMWDISSAGHLTAGDDSLPGAIRELKEELGINISPEQLQLIGVRKITNRPSSTFINREFQDIYLLRLSLDLGNLILQEEEVSAVKYVPLETFRHMIKTNDPTLLINLDEMEMVFQALGSSL